MMKTIIVLSALFVLILIVQKNQPDNTKISANQYEENKMEMPADNNTVACPQKSSGNSQINLFGKYYTTAFIYL